MTAPLPNSIKIAKTKNKMFRTFWETGTLATTKTKRTRAKKSDMMSRISIASDFNIKYKVK